MLNSKYKEFSNSSSPKYVTGVWLDLPKIRHYNNLILLRNTITHLLKGDVKMGVIHKEKIQGPSAWKGKDLLKDDSWIYHWSDEAIAALESALAYVKQKGLKMPNFTKEDFPIPELAKEVAYFNEELENGKGFLLIRGLPIERYTDEEISIIYYGLGLHMGTPVSQNVKGDMLGHVKNLGELDTKKARVYETNEYLPYHADLSDVVGLLSLRKAKSGGLSSLSSAMTLYNELLEKHPEHLGILYRLFLMEHLDDGDPGLTPILVTTMAS